MNEKIFEHLGMTGKEVHVYKLLLKLGEVPVSELFNHMPDHSQIVYRAVDGLAAKNMAIISIKKHRRYVRAEDPRALEQIEEKNLKEIKSIMPELLQLQKNSDEAIVRVFKGVEEVRSARARVVDELTEGGTYYIIGGSADRFYEIMGERQKEIEKKRIKKKIWKKSVTFESQRELRNINDPGTEFAEWRYLPMDYPTPASTGIYNNKVLIFIFTAEPIVILIESDEVAKSYLQNFEALWAIAKE